METKECKIIEGDNNKINEEFYQNCINRMLFIPEKKFMLESEFETDEFFTEMEGWLNGFYEMNKEVAVIKCDFLTKKPQKRAEINNYIKSKHPNKFVSYPLKNNIYFIIERAESQLKLKENEAEYSKCFEAIFEKIYLEELNEIKQRMLEEEKEENMLRESILLPIIKSCAIVDINENSATIEINKISKTAVINRNKQKAITFGRKYKDAAEDYVLFLYDNLQTEYGNFQAITTYTKDEKRSKIIFNLNGLKSNKLYMFKVSYKFDRFFSAPEKSFFFYTSPSSKDSYSYFAFGDNFDKRTALTVDNIDITIDSGKDDDLNIIQTPARLKSNIVNFSSFGNQTLLVLPNLSVVNSGKLNYNEDNKDDGSFDVAEINSKNIMINQMSDPYILSFPIFENVQIRRVSVGKDHCLALSLQGAVYSWGFNAFGQLGLNIDKSIIVGNARKIDFQYDLKKDVFITDISSGNYHSIALGIRNGKRLFYYWGLGQGAERPEALYPEWSCYCVSQPILIQRIEGIENIKSIYAKHDVNALFVKATEERNDVLVFGKIKYHQLGFYNDYMSKDKKTHVNWDLPTYVEKFRKNDLSVLDLKFGKMYTVVLVEDLKEKVRKVYYSGVVPHLKAPKAKTKDHFKEFTVQNLGFENEIVGIGAGDDEIAFLLKNSEIKIISSLSENPKTVLFEKYDTSKYKWNDNKIEANDDNIILMVKNI